jgi:hypothetical protein
MEIVSAADFDGRPGTVQVAQEGDKEPTWASIPKNLRDQIKHGGTWLQAHFGKKYALRIVMGIEPRDWAVCILHMNLRIVSLLVRQLLLQKVTDFAERENVFQKLFQLLRKHGIYVRRKRCSKTKSFDTYFDSIAKHSFHGAECAIMLAIWPEALEIVHPEEKRAKDVAAKEQFDASWAVFEQYAKVYIV